jgi:rhomboid protease GluP
VQLPVRWRYKLDRWRSQIASRFHSPKPSAARPRLCPACGTLVGSSAGRCHQCGASLTFSMAAASRSLGRILPQTTPVSYGILGLCCVLYGVSLLATIHLSGFEAPTGGLGALFGLGGIDGRISYRMGASLPSFLSPNDFSQPWRFITAIFLHGSLLHIGFNMWVLMDLAPTIEDLYGSARFLFIFIITGVCGYVLSTVTGHESVGASGSLLGMVGLLLALTTGRHSIGMRMLRSQLLYWLAYIAIMGFLMRGTVDNFAHIGGFASGFLLGKLMADRQPSDAIERRRANALGWAAGVAVLASFAFMLFNYFQMGLG